MVELRIGMDWDILLVNFLRRAWVEENLMREDMCTEAEKLTESRSTDASFVGVASSESTDAIIEFTVAIVAAVVGIFLEYHGVAMWVIRESLLRRIIASRFSSAVEDNRYSSSSNSTSDDNDSNRHMILIELLPLPIDWLDDQSINNIHAQKTQT